MRRLTSTESDLASIVTQPLHRQVVLPPEPVYAEVADWNKNGVAEEGEDGEEAERMVKREKPSYSGE